jgi:hypothetical protein
MAYDEPTAARDGFIDDLWRAWMMAGPPSYGNFEKLSKRVSGPGGLTALQAGVLSASTTQDILTGRRQHPPKWNWVARFLAVLQVAAAENGLDPGSLGTVAEWKARHEAALGLRPAGQEDSAAHALYPSDWDGGNSVLATRRAVGVEWWRDYRDVVPSWFGTYLSLEPATRLIRTYDTMVPGLLQTEAYASAAVRLSFDRPREAVISRLVELRMRRQQILAGPDAPQLWAIIEEAALHRLPGNRMTMRRQVEHLINLCEHPRIAIQLLPVRAGHHALAGGPVTLIRFAAPELADIIYLEYLTKAIYLQQPDDVAHYSKCWTARALIADTPQQTIELLREILQQI